MTDVGEESDAVLVSRAFIAIGQMKKVEGFAYTEDGYTARIPGAMLESWREVFDRVLFRLRSEIDI
jgi:hypothetical protein